MIMICIAGEETMRKVRVSVGVSVSVRVRIRGTCRSVTVVCVWVHIMGEETMRKG